uniref:Uncharacterized protein n=1 Tax=Arundo donax TaxID=35708 RepID=A0A0A8Z1G3_ARUDO
MVAEIFQSVDIPKCFYCLPHMLYLGYFRRKNIYFYHGDTLQSICYLQSARAPLKHTNTFFYHKLFSRMLKNS